MRIGTLELKIVAVQAVLAAALSGVAPAAASERVAVTPVQYEILCGAIVRGDRAALESLLAPDFASTDTSGKVEKRAAFIADLTGAGPVTLKRCAYAVTSRVSTGDTERDRAVWTVRGTYTSAGSTHPVTGVAQIEDDWVRRDARWQLTGETIFSLKQWLAGEPEPTQTLVRPLSAEQRAAVVADLRKYANALWSAYPGGAESDLAPILRAAGSARVVAMGEGTHGTSEFFALKDRVFRYLVEHGDVTVFAQETNWSDGDNIERYLQTGEGNLRDLLYATFAVWNNQETLELLQWMRAYNIAHPHALHFFGIDMQTPKAAAESVVAFYKAFEPANAAKVADDEACVAVPMVRLMKSQANGPKCIASTRSVMAMLGSDARLQAAAERGAYLTAYHAADVAQESAAMWTRPFQLAQAAERDRAMAHNVEWMLSTLYPRARVFLWAHNGHVGAGLMPWTSMGTLLRANLRTNYFAIGQTFDHGGVSVYAAAPVNIPATSGNASEAIFREAGTSPFFLNFAAVPPRTPLGQWLAQLHGIRTIGFLSKANVAELSKSDGGEAELLLPHAFDAITFVDAGHAAHSFATPVVRDIAFPNGASGWQASVPWTLRSFFGENTNGGASVLPDGRSAMYLVAEPAESMLDTRLETRVDAAAYRGKTLRLRGMLATSAATVGSEMSISVFGKETLRPLAFARGPAKALGGTNAWTPVDVTVTVPQNAQRIDIDFMLVGAGTAWLSNLSLGDDVSAK
jgi:erythromycin esterase